MQLYGLKIREEIKADTDLGKLIYLTSRREGYGVKERDVFAVTSKIVSKAEGRMYKLSDVKPSKKAKLLGKVFDKDARIVELILQNSQSIDLVIPVWKLAQKYGHVFEEYFPNRDHIAQLLRSDPYIFMANVNGLLLTDAGLDLSNAPRGYCTLPPKDPDLSAKRIRERIKELSGKEVGVVITDTEWKFDRLGTVDIALGSSGIEPITKKFGDKDLYGKPKYGGIDSTVDLIAAAANLLMKQTNEGIPVVIIRDLKYEVSERGVKDILYKSKVKVSKKSMIFSMISMIWDNFKFRVISTLYYR